MFTASASLAKALFLSFKSLVYSGLLFPTLFLNLGGFMLSIFTMVTEHPFKSQADDTRADEQRKENPQLI